MDFKALGAIGIGFSIYLLGLGVVALVKWIKNKRHFKKEQKDHEEDDIQD